jgi:hypothetical protein
MWPRAIGILVGLSATAVLLIWSRQPTAYRTPGPIYPDCGGAIRQIAIQYTSKANFAAEVYGRFLPLLPAGVEAVVACPAEADFADLKAKLPPLSCRLRPVFTGHPQTAWAHDRWIPQRRPDGQVLLVAPREEDAADIWPTRKGDEAIAFDLAKALGPVVQAKRSSLYFDGGDFTCDDITAFVASPVKLRNLQRTVANEQELLDGLARLTSQRVVLLQDGPQHHAGMFMMTAGNRTVLVGDPSLAKDLPQGPIPDGADYFPQTQAMFDSVAQQVAAEGYRVVRIPLVPSTNGKSYITALNAVLDRVDGRPVIYMPVFQGWDAFNAATTAVWQQVGYEVKPVDCTPVCPLFGGLRCLVNILQRE